jgi:hypothetical protein
MTTKVTFIAAEKITEGDTICLNKDGKVIKWRTSLGCEPLCVLPREAVIKGNKLLLPGWFRALLPLTERKIKKGR